MLSVVIPSRNEIFLRRTTQDILGKAEGDIEVIAVLDGYWIFPGDIVDKVIYLHKGRAEGMRSAINSGVAIARGEYVMKVDAHCMFDKGFDVKLLNDIEDNWVVVPRRKRLDAENWKIRDVGKPDIDYEHITNPKNGDMHGQKWTQRALKRRDVLIDDTPTFQGSCWLMRKDYFHHLELMDEKNYGLFFNEAQEICLKAWLSGGRAVVNKKTWYAHLHKGEKYGRGYVIGQGQREIAQRMMLKWVENKGWHKQSIDFSALIEYFEMPSWSEEDIKELKKKDRFHKAICPL